MLLFPHFSLGISVGLVRDVSERMEIPLLMQERQGYSTFVASNLLSKLSTCAYEETLAVAGLFHSGMPTIRQKHKL